MMRRTVSALSLGLLAAAAVAAAPSTVSGTTPNDEPTEPKAAPAPGAVQEQLDRRLAERRKAMMEEAHAALAETHNALQALDEGETQNALDALERATGKLELIVARDPELSLAPVDVNFITRDLYATPEAIRAARDQAEDLLDDGRVQDARRLLSGLASEVVVRVTNLPLATYPDAIKEITPLIDDGRTDEAKRALHAALSTLVITDQSISLPVLRANAALDEAQTLAEQDELSDEDRAKLEEWVETARTQIEMAELLGYGTESDHEEYRKQIAELEARIGNDSETQGIFAKLRHSLDHFETSFFE